MKQLLRYCIQIVKNYYTGGELPTVLLKQYLIYIEVFI
jgi:hypothetical protein